MKTGQTAFWMKSHPEELTEKRFKWQVGFFHFSLGGFWSGTIICRVFIPVRNLKKKPRVNQCKLPE